MDNHFSEKRVLSCHQLLTEVKGPQKVQDPCHIPFISSVTLSSKHKKVGEDQCFGSMAFGFRGALGGCSFALVGSLGVYLYYTRYAPLTLAAGVQDPLL